MKSTVLIADGDARLCSRFEQFLGKCGYGVVTSADGLDCMKKLRQVTPDAIVLDLELRWGGGDGVLDWIRQESPARGIPVILTATAEYPQDLSALIKSPAVAYLLKPIALPALLDSVRFVIAESLRQLPITVHEGPTWSNLCVG